MSEARDVENRVKELLEKIMDLPGGWDTMTNLLGALALRDALVAARRQRGLTQVEVAARMGVGQPWISEFETQTWPDPRLSTIRRYALSVGAFVRHELTAIPDLEDEDDKESSE